MSVPKHERLLNLILYLMERARPTSAEDIQREIAGYPDGLTAFRRTFERDKAELREMGVPLLTEPIDADDPNSLGYRIDPDEYGLPDPGLTNEEIAALSVALQAVRLDGVNADAADALRRLGGRDGEAPDALGGAGSPFHVETPSAAGDILAALSEERVVTFRYDGLDRVVEPWRLDHRRGRWYLSGHDRTRGAGRVFRLDRIDGGVEVGAPGSFSRSDGHAPIDVDPWRVGRGDTTVARLAVDAAYAPIVRRHFGLVEPEPGDESGVVNVDVDYRDERGLFVGVLGLLDHVEIVEPPDVRERFVRHLRTIVDSAVAAPGER